MRSLSELRIGVLGLGYVGLPLAIELGKHFPVVGFDINEQRIGELREGLDVTREATAAQISAAGLLSFSTNAEDLRGCNFYVVTVPTTIGRNKRPLFTALRSASELIGRVIGAGDIVVYESTVYPGCTEEFCLPIVEQVSGLELNGGFFAGYSPERVNPGDPAHRLPDIQKITSGSSPETAEFVDAVYARIVRAGTHRVSSIKVAEAAKVIENTQRDINIALMNEFALIFERLGLDTEEVLRAASTKWNFLPFKPGLVGGHCIGVDPYYLAMKAEEIGYHPEMILAGRRMNDGMAVQIASRVIKLMIQKQIQPAKSRVLVLGLTFKENCPDVRNSKVADLVRELQSFLCDVHVHDPWALPAEAEREHGITLIASPRPKDYDAVVIAVNHREFVALGAEGIRRLAKQDAVIYDIKHVLSREEVDGRL